MDVHLLRAHRSVPMDTYLALERELCSCDDHPELRDPDCEFCENGDD